MWCGVWRMTDCVCVGRVGFAEEGSAPSLVDAWGGQWRRALADSHLMKAKAEDRQLQRPTTCTDNSREGGMRQTDRLCRSVLLQTGSAHSENDGITLHNDTVAPSAHNTRLGSSQCHDRVENAWEVDV